MTISVRYNYRYGKGDEAQLDVRIGKEGANGSVSLSLYHEWTEGKSDCGISY